MNPLETFFLLLVFLFLLFWWLKSDYLKNRFGDKLNKTKYESPNQINLSKEKVENNDFQLIPQGARVINVVVDEGQIIEKTYETPSGERFKVIGSQATMKT